MSAHGEVVLASKVTAPVLPDWVVPRARIDRRISEGTCGLVTVITGPPGAGKTTALASWAVARTGALPTAWVTVDQYDNRPESFWSHVGEALRSCGVGVPVSVPDPAGVTGEGFLRRLASVLAGQDPAVVLILDDLHLLSEPDALGGLEYMLRNARSGLRLVAAARAEPQLSLHRYRLAGEMTEIRAADLAFTVAEAALLMARHDINLPRASLETLTRRHEGWAAGLRLAALAMAGHPDPEGFAEEFDAEDRAIAGYLIDEVLSAQPEQAREILLQTSIVDRVSGDLAGDLTGYAQAGETIAGLAWANTFIQPLGHGWYRYHWLFREVLRLKLRRECPQKVAELHCRAARWFWRHGTLTQAVAQATQGADWEMAARMAVTELAIGQLAEPGAVAALADLLQRMPTDLDHKEPLRSLVLAALAARDLQDDVSAARLDDTGHMMDRLAAHEQVPSRLAVAMIQLALARRGGDFDAAADAAARVEDLLGSLPCDLLARHPEARAQVLTGRGAVELWAGHPDDAASLLEAGADAAAGARERADALGHRALVEAVRGRLGRAIELAAAATAPRDAPETPGGVPCAAAEVALAWAQLERHQLDDARKGLSRSMKALRIVPDKLVSSLACLVAARLSLATGHPSAASELLSQARSGWSPPIWLEHKLMLARSHGLTASGDAQAALRIAMRAEPESTVEALIAVARAQVAARDPEAASQTLARAHAAMLDGAPDHVRLEEQLVEAAVSYHRGDCATGRKCLAQALKLAEPEHVQLPFAMERAWIQPVLRQNPGLAEAFERAFATSRPRVDPSQDGQAGPGTPAPVAVEKLSARELEVLRHVSSLESNSEIAEAMYLSIHTVKTHIRHILNKLGVQHRAEAVRMARQLQLL
jgi:LuxR family transcriptional regulator, maltose regulon positive regulatory protein